MMIYTCCAVAVVVTVVITLCVVAAILALVVASVYLFVRWYVRLTAGLCTTFSFSAHEVPVADSKGIQKAAQCPLWPFIGKSPFTETLIYMDNFVLCAIHVLSKRSIQHTLACELTIL